jgi:hypothetical protein
MNLAMHRADQRRVKIAPALLLIVSTSLSPAVGQHNDETVDPATRNQLVGVARRL